MTISREEAIERAQKAVEERGWRWQEPVHVNRTRAYFVFGRVTNDVRTNADSLGGNARVVIDADDGTVLGAYWLPR